MMRIYFEKFFSEDDFEYFSKLAFNEKVMVMNYGRVFTLEEAKMLYEGMLKKNKSYEKFGHFKVFEKETNNFIGIAALVIDKDFIEAEVEYMLLPEYWGKKFGSEIVAHLLKMAEETKRIQKVTGIIDPNNIASRKILLNNGFVSVKKFINEDDGSVVESLSKELLHQEI